MKKLLKRLLQFGPILVLIALGVLTAYQRNRIDAQLRDPNGLVWHSDATRLTVRASEKRKGALSQHEIQVVRDDGTVAHESQFEIDWNAGLAGGGFVRATQADADPEPEVVAWAGNADSSKETRRPFFLDHSQGELRQRPFSEASDEIRDLTQRWIQVNVVRQLEITLAIVLVVVYYVLFGLVVGLIALVRRTRRQSAET
jgi:hypothetical protein